MAKGMESLGLGWDCVYIGDESEHGDGFLLGWQFLLPDDLPVMAALGLG